MKLYIPKHRAGAGLWIYQGYYNAWKFAGYDVEYYSHLSEVDTSLDEYAIMATEGGACIDCEACYKAFEKATKVFLYVQPHTFPMPWGSHPNFVAAASDDFVSKVSQMEHVRFWSFANTSGTDFWKEWGKVHYVPLAFDSIGYDIGHNPPSKCAFDICYVGGIADNGFNEKARIMHEFYFALQSRGINVDGFFVNKNISMEKEAQILRASKICLNIHDRYQHALGLDCNERTFKSLGLNGLLVSDTVKCLDDFGDLQIHQTKTPEEMADTVEALLSTDNSHIKEANRAAVLENHTYIDRVNQLLCL